ncbi:protein Largen isoform X2 [Ctenopharyngodon idella]|uniref:protein Largen isoform X2 n=1 Tax=Ctenopharyngodon idella TaxID=7959 RepID=UPI00222EC6FE|nr:protein Largen isoform X2 [Ctenopharyngodon idella]
MSGSAAADADGGVNKVRVKRQIRGIVKDLENILGDLKDVAKELKEVVQEIDCLTSDLHLEEDSSKTDTLNSSSSSSTTTTTTASSTDRIKIYPEETLFRPAPLSPAVLTVLKRPTPPLPPPRTTPSSTEITANGVLMRNGVAGRDSLCRGPKSAGEKGHTSRCPQTTRERVRFSEKVQYHGYCPDCDLQYDMNNTDLHLHAELMDPKPSPVHQCSALMENGGLTFPSQKPQKTILRKSTSTTV